MPSVAKPECRVSLARTTAKPLLCTDCHGPEVGFWEITLWRKIAETPPRNDYRYVSLTLAERSFRARGNRREHLGQHFNE